MEDLLSIIALIVYFVIAGAAAKKKKTKKQKKAASKRAVEFDQAFERMTKPRRKQVETILQTMTQQEMASRNADEPDESEGTDPCHQEMLSPERPSMRAKTVTQIQMHQADEGEDPCHPGSAQLMPDMFAEDPDDQQTIFDTEDPRAFARDVLRGVIMSEVLERPAHRRYGGMKRGT